MYLPASATHVARRGTSVITISALGVVALLGSTLLLLRSAEAGGANASVTSPQVKSSVALERNIVGNYGRLPLSFEMNTGQTDSRVRFLSRGSGYGLFLTSDSAILMLTGGLTPSAHRAPADSGGAHGSSHGSALAMEMKGASANATVMGVDALPGITNYLLGNEPRNWKTNITGFSRVKYKKLYPGVDLTYYGNHQQLEWDFTVAPGTSVGKIRMEFSGADKLRVNEGGDLVITTKAGEILFQRPITYQDVEGRRVTIGSRYRLMAKNEIAFQIDSYNTHLPLVIDPVLVYSSYLGGSDDDRALGIAVDALGNAYVVGQTSSPQFPSVGGIQPVKAAFSDAFVTKLNAAGSAIVYSTFLGGNGSDVANGIALDSAGNAYVTGQTGSSDFPTTNALQSSFGGSFDAFVAELNSNGSALVYSTFLGGGGFDSGNSIAVDHLGNAYVTGIANSRDFPTTNPIQGTRSGNSIFKSTNAAGSWGFSDSALLASNVLSLTFDPVSSTTLYAAGENGIFKSTNSGGSWSVIGSNQTATPVNKIAIDPTNSAIIYVATNGGMFRSTNSGTNFTAINNGLVPTFVRTVLIDPLTPTTLYGISISNRVHKSTSSGNDWTTTFINGVTNVNALTIDPATPATLYAGTNRGVFKTTNGGTSWIAANSGIPFEFVRTIAIDRNNSSVLYAGSNFGIFKSLDGGANWTNITGSLGFLSVTSIALDPNNASTIYVAGGAAFIYKTTDGGMTWNPANIGYSNVAVNSLVIDPSNASTLYVGTSSGSEAFVSKISAGGVSAVYSTYLGGSRNDVGNGIAADGNGNAYVTGLTSSLNFPLMNAFQAVRGDSVVNDAFVTKINSTGSAFVYSTYLGGGFDDQGSGIAVDNLGNAYLTGFTRSMDFPTVNALQPANAGNSTADIFVTKMNPAGSALVYSTYLGGASDDFGVKIAIDSSGAAFITGETFSNDFPLLNATQTTKDPFTPDAFISKLTPSGAALGFSTYLGGNSDDIGQGIAVDSAGNPYVVGTTFSTNFPSVSPLQATFGGFSDAFITKVGPTVELAITMTDAPDPIAFGSDLTYTITVRNNGELTGTGVMLTDNLPAGATFVSATPSQGSCTGTSTVTCNLGALSSGGETIVNMVIKPPAVISIINTATVTLNEPDGNPTNNTVSQTTQVNFADLSINASTAYRNVAPGARINYLLPIKNNSGRMADSITVTDNLPSGTTFLSCNAVGGTCGGSGNNRTVTFPSLDVGQSALVIMVAVVDLSLAEGTTLTNTPTVDSVTPDTNSSNNAVTIGVTITSTPLRRQNNGLIALSTGQIFTVKSNGSESPVPFPIASAGTFPRWSPDGMKMAFAVTDQFNSFTAIKVTNADGTGSVTVADNSMDLSFNNRSGFSWSPDGTRIVYVGQDGLIYLANVDGSGYAKLPNAPPGVKDIDWSPDGSRFVFSKDGEIFTVNVDGSGLTKLVPLGIGPNGPLRSLVPVWSPDMTKILFAQQTRGVFVINSDGTGMRRLLNSLASFAPAWSPDGTKVAFYLSTDVRVINFDGANEITLTSNEQCCDFGSIRWQSIPTNNPLPPPGPPAITFSISGRIPLAGGTFLKLSGSRTATTSPDSNGDYSFVNLPQGGSYTVTPTSFFSKFNPASRLANNLQQDLSGWDFVATPILHTVNGRLTDINGSGLAGQTVSLLRFGSRRDTTTDAQGNYVFANVFPGDGYMVQPSAPNMSFDSVLSVLPPVFNDVTANIVGASLSGVRSIGGRIVDSGGNSMAGMTITLDGGRKAVLKTNVDGTFNFFNLPVGLSYTLTPSTDDGFAFTTPQQTFNNLTNDQFTSFNATTTQPTVEFSAIWTSIGEGDRVVDLTILRTGASTAASVDYETADGTASERTDYLAAFGTLKFNNGESAKSLKLLLTDDTLADGDRTFTVTLKNGSGVRLGSKTTTTILIVDNETTSGGPNPIDDSRTFVRQQYADFLNREPDPSGLDFWTNEIEQCGTDAQCREVKRINVSAAFFLSIEFQGTGYLVYRMHDVAFGTSKNLRLKAFLHDTVQIGQGVVVGQGAWEQQLENNKRAFAGDFGLRPDFMLVYPTSMAESQFVDMLNTNAGGVLSASERNNLVDSLTTNSMSRGEVVRTIAENQIYSNQQFNRAFVLMQYFGYLRRNPDDPPDSNFDGWQFWLDKLNQFNGNFVNAEMVKAFITSGEYRQRFGN